MRRVVYCPTESDIEESTTLAKMNYLPINIGEFEQSIDLDFDRNIVQVLEIPEFKDVQYFKEIKNGFHQKINYLNDFILFDKNYYILINNIAYFPILIEKHKIKFLIKETEIGAKNVKIIKGENTVEEFEYNVY